MDKPTEKQVRLYLELEYPYRKHVANKKYNITDLRNALLIQHVGSVIHARTKGNRAKVNSILSKVFKEYDLRYLIAGE